MQKLLIRLVGVLIILATITFGLWLAGTYLWGVSVALRSPGWPTVPGVVTAADVCEHYSKSGTRYAPCLTYRYAVHGQTYHGHLITGAPRQAGDRDAAAQIAQQYAVGTAVTVAYDPRAPAVAVLEPGVVPWEAYAAIAVGLGLAAFGLFLPLLVLHNAWARRPRAGF